MAFKNEKLTQEERELFAQRNIINPIDYPETVLKPSYWTIDKEKEAILFKIGVQRDIPEEEVFFYQVRDKAVIVSVKQKIVLPNTLIWSLKNTYYNPFKEIKKQVLVNEWKTILKAALKEYGVWGKPQEGNEPIEVFFEEW